MRPDGVNGSVPAQQTQQPSLVERIGNVNVSDTTDLSKNINDISTDVNKKIQEFFSQGSEEGEKISVNEKTEIGNIKTSLMNLYYNMRNKYVQAEQEYKQLLDNLLDLIKQTTDAKDGKNPNEVALEPTETDTQRQKQDDVLTWSPSQQRESDGKTRGYVYVDYQNAMKEPDKSIRKGLLEIIISKYGANSTSTDLNKNYARLNQKQTQFIQNQIYEITKLEVLEQEEKDKRADILQQKKDNEQSQIGSDFLNRGDNARKYEKTMIASAHEENGKFYWAMTGHKPPKK